MVEPSKLTVFPSIRYEDAPAAIRFLTGAFGFVEHAVHEGPNGTVAHAELAYRNGMVMIGSAQTGGSIFDLRPVCVYVVVADTDSHYRRAVEAGAEILMEPTDQDYGSRDYAARDPEGNVWAFGTYAPTLPTS